jgi:hypothetical protein
MRSTVPSGLQYNVTNFLDKNKDLVWKDLLLIGESSTSRIMSHATMFPKGAAANASLARPITAGTNFKTQVQTLMDTLSKCQPHYMSDNSPNITIFMRCATAIQTHVRLFPLFQSLHQAERCEEVRRLQ